MPACPSTATRNRRSLLLRTGLPVAGALGVVYAVARARDAMANWGATRVERRLDLPGDDLIDDPLMGVTRSVGIDAPASAVWPWIAQMGSSGIGRAGWYSYDRLDNAGVPSAVELLPDVPEPRVGDRWVDDATFGWTVREVEPGRAVVLDIVTPPGKLSVHATFALVVEPADEGHSRLVERSWWDMQPRWAGVPFSAAFEVIDFVMMRKHLLGVRDRAESLYARRLTL